jgi:tetratricopeptide (TPR) repeat protein
MSDMGTNESGNSDLPKDTKAGPTPEAAPPNPSGEPETNERVFKLDLGEGFDEALDKLKDRASHYMKRGQHTQVRIKFRGREVATMPLPMLLAVEAATFIWTGPLRLIVANALGRTFLEVEFINEADQVVSVGKERLLDGELDEALEKFKEALVMDRDHAGAHLNLGVALKLKGDREGSVAAFEKAVALDPNGDAGKEGRRQLEKMKK